MDYYETLGVSKSASADGQAAYRLLGESPETLWLMARIEHGAPAGRATRNDSAERLLQRFPASQEANWLRAGQWQSF